MKIKSKTILLIPSILILIYLTNTVHAQTGFAFRGGIGNYDLGNVGIQYQFTERSSFELYGGSNLSLGNRTSWSAGLNFNQVFVKPIVWDIKAGYSLGSLYWTWEDEYYYFRTISAPFMFLLAYPVTQRLMIRAENGIIFSVPLESTRNQNVKAGFPDRINYACGINIIYKLGEK